jgi:hypothetical protein
MAYRLRVSKRFKKARAKKDAVQQDYVNRTLATLRENPRHNSLHTHKVHGSPGVWESYINDSYRVTWHYEGSVIVLRMTCAHRIIDRNP